MTLQIDLRPSQRPGNSSSNQAWLRALEKTGRIVSEPSRTLPVVVEELADTFGDAPALLSEQQSMTYRELAEASNRYSRWALMQGIGVGDCVGLLMPNRPEYLAIWLGISRVGGIVALLNTNLRGASLAHCIGAAGPRHAIVESTLQGEFEAAQPTIDSSIRCWAYGGSRRGFTRIDEDVSCYSGDRLSDAECRAVTTADRALLIYTSGTTGLPKAANVSHQRIMMWCHWFAGMADVQPSDRMYNCLPMFHSIGGVVAIGATLVGGGSVLLRERFSASQFWRDVVDHECTLFQYIGELCRYLVNSPRSAQETKHRLRLCCGNGLRADVWEQFVDRFKIPQVLEYYAATENNFSLFNCEGKPGAIGRIPSFLTHRFNVALVKLDADGREPARNESGLCIRCAPGEPGEAIGQICAGANNQAADFEGYTDAAASNKKILRDVFIKGDVWLRSGDMMRKDDKGYFYFVDRLGDTFRWKGENVATNEVCDALLQFPGIIDATVYGVEVPGTEGRAGMATMTTRENFDLRALREHLIARLPSYARPVFLRIRNALELTDTFKHKKQDLVRESFDPEATADAIYVNDQGRQAFVRMQPEAFKQILAGEISF